jgi:HAD superfamily hydrolase (TIGR01509 family)
MRNKKYLLWDHDGVLVDTEKWFYMATCRAMSELGIEVDKTLYLDFMQDGKSLWTIASKEGFTEKVIFEQRRKRDTYYQEFLINENIEIPGVEETLAILDKTYSMAIVTTSKRKDFELIHQHRSIVQFMDFVLTIEDYHRAKPDPEPYLAALQKYGAVPEDALVLEDSGRGLKAALAAGIDCVIIENEFTSSHDFADAKMILKSITELEKILTK